MVFVWAKQETVLAVLKKCPRCLVYVRQYANVFSVGPYLYFINREDRRYTKNRHMQIYADFLSFFFLPNPSAKSAQGLLNYDHLKRDGIEMIAVMVNDD